MTAHIALKLQQSPLGAVLPECWKLVPERAVTLHPDGAGILRISGGRVWATVDGPHHGPANDWGDVVLRSGEQLQLLPGQQVVVEAYGEAVNEPAYFSWEPAPTAPAQQGGGASPWGDVLARPMLGFEPGPGRTWWRPCRTWPGMARQPAALAGAGPRTCVVADGVQSALTRAGRLAGPG